MKKFLLILLYMLITMCSSIVLASDDYDTYIVKFKDEYTPTGISLYSTANSTIEPIVEEWNMYTVSADDIENLDPECVEYIEPNYRLRLYANFIPNDEFYRYQWNLGQIKVPYMWNFNHFGSGVKVGVIDSGIDINHPDLKNKILVDDCMDCTGSGYIGEIDRDIFPTYNKTLHGTTVSGIISAEINNSIGVAGISNADIIMFKVFKAVTDSTGTYYYGDTSYIISAIHNAVNKCDCDVINMSLGFTAENGEEIPESDYTLRALTDAIDFAYENGVILVAASGNDGDTSNAISYPAYNEHVISVGAVDRYKDILYFSTYNKQVDVVAPGYNLAGIIGNYTASNEERDPSNDYASGFVGTSFSSPHVAGIAAIVKGIDPTINQDTMELLIKYSSDDLGEPGHDYNYGWGLLNAEKILKIVNGDITELLPGSLEYDVTGKKFISTYFNPSKESTYTGASVMVAVFDADGVLVETTEICEVEVLPFTEAKLIFDNIEIPYGGTAKAFCMEDWSKIIPATEVLEL